MINPRFCGKLSVGDAAYCAAAWASGEKQLSLAHTYGFKTPSTISSAIGLFLHVYTDGKWGADRRDQVRAGLKVFKATL